MEQTKTSPKENNAPASQDTVSRELFRQVIRQRQELKKELRALKNELADLPSDWRERMKTWLDLEAKAEGLTQGELIEAEKVRAERAGWEARERALQQRIAQLTLGERIRAAAVKNAAFDPEDVVSLTRRLFAAEFKDGEVRIGLSPEMEEVGLERFDAAGVERPLEEVISQFLAQKPHLVRAGAATGSGSRPQLIKPTTLTPLDPAEQARQLLAQRQRVQGRSS